MSRFNQGGNFRRDNNKFGPRDDGAPIDALKFVRTIIAPNKDLALMECIDQGRVPRFNASVTNKGQQVGVVDDILGPINRHFIVMKPSPGVSISSFKEGTVFQLGEGTLLPIAKFLPQPTAPKVKKAAGPKGKPMGRPMGNFKGNDRGGFKGGNDRGGFRGGNDSRGGFNGGNDRGNDRGGFRGGNDRPNFRNNDSRGGNDRFRR